MPRCRPTRSWCLIAVGVLAPAAWARGDTPVPEELIQAMASRDFAQREAATNQLIGRGDVRLKDIEAALARPDLAPEQRVRLLQAARARFMDSPRGALGVRSGGGRMNNPGFLNGEAEANVIQGTVEGFASSKVLKPNDQLLAIDGRTLPPGSLGMSQARPYIICNDPGDTVPLVIRRDGQVMTVDVQLGRYSDLQQPIPMPLSEDELRQAWALRQDRYARARPVIDPEDGARGEIDPAGRVGEGGPLEWRVPWSAVAGGQPGAPRDEGRWAHAGEDRAWQREVRGGVRVVNVNGRVWVNGREIPNRPGQRMVLPGDIQVRIDPALQPMGHNVDQQVADLDAQLEELNVKLAQPGLTRDDLRRVMEMRAKLQTQRLELTRQRGGHVEP